MRWGDGKIGSGEVDDVVAARGQGAQRDGIRSTDDGLAGGAGQAAAEAIAADQRPAHVGQGWVGGGIVVVDLGLGVGRNADVRLIHNDRSCVQAEIAVFVYDSSVNDVHASVDDAKIGGVVYVAVSIGG